MAGSLQGFLMDLWAFCSPNRPHNVGSSDSSSCTEEEQDGLNTQRQFELRQPIFFISGKCRQGNFPCWKSDLPLTLWLPSHTMHQHQFCIRHPG